MFLKVGLVLIDAHRRQGSRDHRSERTQIIFGDDFNLRIQRHAVALMALTVALERDL